MSNEDLKKLCYSIPKAELHLHIEGTFEPELIFSIAHRNNKSISSKSIQELKSRYKFNNLQEFLNLYYEACDVLLTQKDFSDLSYAYGTKAYSQGLKYAEIFFDPQSHLRRVSFETLIFGLRAGLDKVKSEHKDFDYNLIMCFLRDLSEEDAIKTFELALPYKKYFIGIGLDSAEVGNPPEKFKNVFERAKKEGLHLVAHAGEEGDSTYIKNAIDYLNVERIDHGIQILADKELVERVAKMKIPLTLCPISNNRLQVCPDLKEYKIRELMKMGLSVMINSDDPSYFGGYVGDNYYALVENIGLNKEEIIELAKNSFRATFLPEEIKKKYIEDIDKFL